MKIALRTCWVNARSARLHLTDQRESAVAVHLDHPDRLLDVMVAGELEFAQRCVDVDRLHRVAELGAVAGRVTECQVRPLCRVGKDEDGGVALGGELVRVLTVLGSVRRDEAGVRGKSVVDVPGTSALGALAVRAGRLRDLRRVEAVAAQELPGESLLARLPNDVGRDIAQAGDEDDVRVLLHRLRYEWREISRRFGEGDRGQQLNAELANRVGDDRSAVLRKLVVIGHHQYARLRMLRIRVDLDVGRDRRLFAETVAEDVLAGDGGRSVAVGHDVDARGADREDRNLEAFGQRVNGDGGVRESRTEEREELALLDERLGNLSRLRPIRGVILDVEGDLGTIHPARIVDLVNRQEHPVPRAGAVNAAGASYL